MEAITIIVQLVLCVVFTMLTYWGITDADDKATRSTKFRACDGPTGE